MLKTEQDLKRADDMYAKKTISIQEYNAAQAAYDVAKNTYESSLHEIERAEAGSSQARDALSKTTVYSPIDGTVTILNSKLGERIVATGQFAGTEVMRVADLNHMEARVDVNENDVVNVKVGDKAEHQDRCLWRSKISRHGLANREHRKDDRRRDAGGSDQLRGEDSH